MKEMMRKKVSCSPEVMQLVGGRIRILPLICLTSITVPFVLLYVACLHGIDILIDFSILMKYPQIKTTMRYHFTPVRMAIINKSTNNKCWWGCGEKGTIVHCWWDCRLMQPLWKTVWNFLRKLKCNCLLTPQFHCWGYTLRILKHWFKRTYVP